MNPLTYVVIRTMAVNQGIDTSDANTIGLVGSLPKSPVMGIVLGTAMIRNDLPAPAPAPASGLPSVSLSALPAPPGNLQVDKVPHLHTFTGTQVMNIAKDMGFQLVFDKDATEPNWIVDEQWPAAGRPIPQDKIIKVRLVPAVSGKKS